MLEKFDGVRLVAADADYIKNEPMVYSASPEFAYQNGGNLTSFALSSISLDENMDNCVIDTRVHMLKPGWFPSIPGWHCDAIPRDSQKKPDLNHPQIDSIFHYLFIVDFETGSLTEFLDGDHSDFLNSLPKEAEGENLWGLHSRLIKEAELPKKQIESGYLYKFDAREYHNTTPATGHGWRFFFRASFNTLTRGPYNEVRNQVQTYLPYEDLGW